MHRSIINNGQQRLEITFVDMEGYPDGLLKDGGELNKYAESAKKLAQGLLAAHYER